MATNLDKIKETYIKRFLPFVVLVILIIILKSLVDNKINVKDLKKETFYCSGKGGTGRITKVLFSIDPETKTLTFVQDGTLMGKLINYPNKIIYNIKLSSGDKILTSDNTFITVTKFGKSLTFYSYIETFDKEEFYYGFRKSKNKRPAYVFKNCKRE